ncbi:MAG: Fic family protein [bacterium]
MYENKIKEIEILQKEIRQFRPLKPKELKKLKEYFRVGLTYSSNSIEGNSLTETETKIILEEGITIGGKSLRDHYEVSGHSDSYNLMYKLAKNKEITEKDILKLHKLFYYRINIKKAGKYRKEQVFITGTDFVPPKAENIHPLMKEFIQHLSELRETKNPVEFAAIIHKELVTIHPFVDGNGRCARLLMNLAFLQDGYPIVIIPPILRNDYISAIKKTQVTPKDDKPFINFISSMVYESQKDYLRMLNNLD